MFSPKRCTAARNRRLPMALLAAVGTVILSTPAWAQAPAPAAPIDPAKVVATVDGLPVTERDLQFAVEDMGGAMPQLSPEQRRDYLVNFMTDLKLAAKAAGEKKIDESPDFKARLGYYRDKVLVDEYLAQEAKKAVSEEAMKKLYDETVKATAPEEEVRARHILVEGEEDAKKAHARVTTGKEDFAKVATELSKDPGSGKDGGDLGYFAKDRMVPEFGEVAFKLEKGAISAPVKSQFGWHIIKLEDKRSKPTPTYDQVKDQLERYLVRKAHTDLILALREKAKVERLDKPAAPPAAPAAPAEAKKQ
ncbi:MAG: peptidylprolyl isomerase [Beijerinckiaceae bacterium]